MVSTFSEPKEDPKGKDSEVQFQFPQHGFAQT